VWRSATRSLRKGLRDRVASPRGVTTRMRSIRPLLTAAPCKSQGAAMRVSVQCKRKAESRVSERRAGHSQLVVTGPEST